MLLWSIPAVGRRLVPRFCRCLSTVKEKDERATREFLLELGYARGLADGIISALSAPASGIPSGALLPTVKAMAGRWEVDEDAGLQALAQAVRQDMARIRDLMRLGRARSSQSAFV